MITYSGDGLIAVLAGFGSAFDFSAAALEPCGVFLSITSVIDSPILLLISRISENFTERFRKG